MNPKNTWILVALAAALFAFIYFFERHFHEPPPPPTRVFADLKAAEVTSLQIQPADRLEIRADLTNGSWQLTQPLNYPAQTSAIEALLQALEKLDFQMHISAQDLRGHPKASEEYGVATPRLTILVQQGEAVQQLKIGNLTPPGDQVYVQVVGMEGVDIVSADLLKLIPRQPDDWRDPAFANLKGLAFDRLAVTNGAKVLELQRDPTNKFWRMTWPMQTRADNPRIDELLYRLQNLRVSRFETNDPRADLEAYGLQPALWTLAVGQGTNVLVAFQFGKSPTNDDTQIYARRSGQDGIVLVARDQLEPWRADHEKFRDPHLAGLTSATLNRIEVSGQEAESFALQRQTNDSWIIVTKTTNLPPILPADAPLMHDFIDTLGNLAVVPVNGQFAVSDAVTESAFPSYGLATPARKYILFRAVTNAASGPTNGLLAELDFGSQKEGKVFARRPEESSVYAVSAEDYHRLPATALALLQRRIWSFSENSVKMITIRQNGASLQLGHTGTNSWTLIAGSGSITPFAVEQGAAELGALEAENWLAYGATNRAQYGFSDKSLRISVEFFGPATAPALTLELGGWSADKRRYAAVQLDGQTWIFTLPPKLLERIISYLSIQEKAAP